ncbi:MAG: J domain-containing protein, partial [Colwellia sp.]
MGFILQVIFSSLMVFAMSYYLIRGLRFGNFFVKFFSFFLLFSFMATTTEMGDVGVFFGLIIICSIVYSYRDKVSRELTSDISTYLEAFFIRLGMSRSYYKQNEKRHAENARSYEKERERYEEERKKYEDKNKQDSNSSEKEPKNEPMSKEKAMNILDLTSPFNKRDIEKAFRRKAAKYHPDKVASMADEFKDLANEKMKE